MSRRTVRTDRHGPYLRAGGYLFRPQLSARSSRQVPVLTREGAWQHGDVATRYQDGDTVTARHRGGSTFGVVGDELWYSHGRSSQPPDHRSRTPSEHVWEPATSGRQMAAGQWISASRHIVKVEQTGSGWKATDSRLEVYTSESHPRGIKTFDQPTVSGTPGPLTPWPAAADSADR